MNKEIIIALCAGEASGDLLGAHLIEALKQQYSHIRFVGIGGPRMKAAGLISMEEQEPLAVRGYVEVLGSLSEILKIRRHLIKELKSTSPHVFVGIDAPNFNLPVAAKLKEAGIPTLHYVSPSVWAWKPERVHKIVRQVNKVLCLFPMEPQLYRQAGGQAEYVGHPLAQILPMENSREAVRERLKLNLTTPVFALLPGSRVSEVDYMAPVFLRAAKLILRDLPDAVFLMPYPSAAVRERLQHYLKQSEFQTLPIRLQAAKAELAYMAADVVLVTSGTASLEVALCKRPMVISYKISPLTYSLVKRKIKIPYVGLPNILLNKMVVPELLQNDATPEKLAAAVLDWYYHPARVGELEQQFKQLHQRLQRNTDELAAYAVLTEAGLRLPKPIAEGEAEDIPAPPEAPAPDVETAPVVEDTMPTVETAPTAPADVEKIETEKVETEKVETPNPPTMVFRQPESSPLIPPPSIVLGNQMAASNDRQPENPPPPLSPEPTPQASQAVFADVESEINKINHEFDDMNPNKVKRKSGLFGWLSSLFSSKSAQTQPENVDTPTASASDVSLVAVARAEEGDTVKTEPSPAPEAVAPSETTTAEPAQPTRVVIEKDELPSAAPQMHLPKSSVLTVNKPNIFDKYKTETEQQPSSAESSTPSQAASPAAPSITVPTVARQPALKVKVTAVMRKPDEQPQTTTAEPATPASQVEAKAEPKIEPTPTVPEAQTNPAVAPLPAGALAEYIKQASMAWLPDSMAKSQPNPTDTTEQTPETPAVAPQIVVNTPPVANKPAAPSITIQVAPKVKPQPEVSTPATPASPSPLVDVKTPELSVAVSNQVVAKTVETAAPVVTPVITPVVEKAVETPAPVVAPVITPVVEKTAEPVVQAAPAVKSADDVGNSFASVFRRHTLQTEQAEQADQTDSVAETETESDAPNQIILNRSEAMSGAPTQAAQPETPSEDGLTAPRVSNYSSNPNRYNSGIFF